MTDRASFLAEYEKWVRAGRPGLAPSPLPHGIMAVDVLKEICTIDEKVRAESGLGSWLFYAPTARGSRR